MFREPAAEMVGIKRNRISASELDRKGVASHELFFPSVLHFT